MLDGFEDSQTDTDDASNKDTVDYSGITDSSYHVEVDLSAGSPVGQVIKNSDSSIEQTDTLVNIENVIGSSGDDTITGSDEANILDGSSGDDTFVVKGSIADNKGDTIIGGKHTVVGNSQGTINAAVGKGDTVDYSNMVDTITLTMANGTGETTVKVGTDTTNHKFSGIENIIGSSASDTITGNSFVNTIKGGASDDTIDGGAGADVLDGGFTNDGSGNNTEKNTISFASSAVGVTVNLTSGTTSENDDISNFTNIIGTDLSSQSDTLIGDGESNKIEGLKGNDTLEGLGGDDHLLGGEGDDSFILRADDGTDIVEGGVGSGDTLDYSNLTSNQNLNITIDTATSKVATVTDTQGTVAIGDDVDYTDNVVDIENVTGGAGDDRIIGDTYKNTLKGNDGEDYIHGGAGNDELHGGAGDDNLLGGTESDTLYGGAGDDNLSGGAGLDTIDGGEDGETDGDSIDYSDQTLKLDINLKKVGTDLADYSTATIGAVAADYLKDIENIKGGTNDDYIGGDDDKNTLQGSAGDDIIVGAGGDDVLLGGDGKDTFKAGLDNNVLAGQDKVLEDGDDGADIIDGDGGVGSGVDTDTVDYSAISKSISVDLSDIEADTYTTVTVDTYANDKIKNIENIIGSSANDTISGDNQNNILDGSLGDDTLYGAGGDDTLKGGSGTDVADYSSASQKIIVDMTNVAQEVTQDGDSGADDLDSIEVVIGTDYEDTMTGSSSEDTFVGGADDDDFYGSSGSDTIYGGVIASNGTHSIDASEFNKVDYAGATKIRVDLSSLTSDGTNSYAEVFKSNIFNSVTNLDSDFVDGVSLESTDKLYGITNIYGTSSADIIIGDGSGNKFKGQDGDDTLEGKGGVDLLYGGDGADTFNATSKNDGADIIDGEGGLSDTVDYSALGTTAAIRVTLGTAGAQSTLMVSDTTATDFTDATNDDKISNIENVTGTDLADSIYGNDLDNILKGGAGDDTLEGGAGDDTLDGGTEDANGDTAYYNQAIGSVSVNLGIDNIAQAIGGGQGSDKLISIENVIGSSYDDTFYTNFTKANSFAGGVEDDEINGDTVDYSNLKADIGGANYTGTEASDNIFLDLTNNTVAVRYSGSTVVDKISNIENIVATSGDDTLYGDDENNTLKGLLGDDILEGGKGDDYLDGGTGGNDTAYYNQATSGVNVDLGIDNIAQAIGGEQGSDTLVSIENVIGSQYNDTFRGNNAASNIFDGGYVLSTGVENINDENDTVDYSSLTNATDKIVVDLSNTTTANVAVTVTGTLQNPDTLRNIENIIGSFGDDTFTGNSDSNKLEGKDGDDTFLITSASVGAEADIIDGGANTTVGDTVDFSGVTNINYFVDVNLGSQDLLLKDQSNSDVVVRDDTVLNIENITGTQNEDRIIGDSSKNILKGEAGTDHIEGGAGNDIIYGGDNTDNATTSTTYEFLDGGADDDTIYGGAGNDSIYGGSGIGEDSLYGEAGDDIIRGGSGIDVIDGGADDDTLSGDAGEDTLYGGLGDDEISGGTEGDVIYGDDSLNADVAGGADILYGGDGTDTLYGGYGDDTLEGGANDDHLYGGDGSTINSADGSDTVTYKNASNSVTVNLANQTATGDGADTLHSIENAIGSAYDDIFISDFSASNRFDGNEGSETSGDSISYEAIVVTDPTLDKVVVNLSTEVGEVNTTDGYFEAVVTYDNGTKTFTDYLVNIENVTGSKGDDTITGANDDNKIYGLEGDDLLSGGLGDDTLDGGLGSDTASYSEKSLAVTVDFKNNIATTTSGETDTLVSIENAIGGSGKDTFIMNEDSKANTIDGGVGSEEDTISYANYTANGVNVNLSTTSAQTIQAGDVDTIKNIEHIIGSTKADIFIGSSGDNSIVGGSGNDTFIAGTDTNNDGVMDAWSDDGADYVDGGVGTGDWADYSVIDDDGDIATNGIEVTLDGANEVEVTVNGQTGKDTLLNIENISGTQDSDSIKGDGQNNSILGNAGADIISGEGGLDNLFGGADNDTLLGGAGDDKLYGEDGDDTLTGGVGSDKLYGGSVNSGGVHIDSGIDTVDYTNALESLTIDLDVTATGGLDQIGSEEGRSDGATGDQGQGVDELYGIENVIGSNFANDIIYGNGVKNIITSKAGDDYIEARDGADTVYAGAGDDTIVATGANDGADYYDGGVAGSDTLDYSALGVSENITVDLSVASTVDFDGVGGFDAWTVSVNNGNNDIIKEIENIIGGAGDDIITMNAGVNELQGGAGADTLSGNDGIDTIYGYKKGESESSVEYDTVSYEYLTTKSVTLDLQLGTATIDANDKDTLISIENAIGGDLADNITGSTAINILQGGAGDDTFVSSSADDLIYGGTVSSDSHDIGDMVDYSNSLNTNNNLVVNLSTTIVDGANSYSTAQVRLDSDDSSVFIDRLYGIENISGTQNDDTLTGNTQSNTLIGNAGDDTLQGGLGIDKLDGGAGADTFLISEVDIGDVGGDEIIGGSEYDTLDYSGITTTGVTVNLETGADVVIGSYTHEFSGIEHLIGTNQKDILTGDINLNKVQGLGGDDLISGQDGGDYLYGGNEARDLVGSGDDTIFGLGGNDKIYGGDGKDTLDGGDGTDTVYGEAGDDTLLGGIGNDTLYGGDGADTFKFGAADNQDDVVYAGNGAGIADDDSENDLIDYTQAIKGMTVTLGEANLAGTATSQDQGTDTIYGIEHVKGSNIEGDTLTGNSDTNTLYGQGQNDTLYGKDGADHLLGGTEDDILYGDDNDAGTVDDGAADILEGGAGNDTLYGGAGDDLLTGNSGDDTFYASSWDDGADVIDGDLTTNDGLGDTVDYSALTDTDNKIEVVLQNSGTSIVTVYDNDGTHSNTDNDDTISNIENITGTSGADTITGNSVANILIGGSGVDTVKYDYDAVESTGVQVDLENETAKETVSGTVITDTIKGIENVIGSDWDDSFITKSGVTNTIDGGESDVPNSREEVYGDTIDYSSKNNTINVTLNEGTLAEVFITGNNNDFIKNIENVTGSTADDIITGDISKNTLLGMAGADKLDGAGGADYIDGGTGDDEIIGGAGADILKGGTGDDYFTQANISDTGDDIDGGDNSDTVDYSGIGIDENGGTLGNGGIFAKLANGEVIIDADTDGDFTDTADNKKDIIANIENISGTQNDDSLVGNDESNSLLGNGGADYINGAIGADFLVGGDGIDTIYGGTDNDTIYGDDTLSSNIMVNDDELYGEDGDDKIYGGYGDDTLDGGAGEDELLGGYGDDTLIGGADDDKLKGDEGSDTAYYAGETNSIDATLTATGGNATGTSIGIDIYTSIENITGSQASDNITGNNLKNILDGQDGDDVIKDGGGEDTVIGGKGDDYFYAGTGADKFDGGEHTIDAGTTQGSTNPYRGKGDTIDYTQYEATSITVDLTQTVDGEGYNNVTVTDANGGYIDKIQNIENITGTSGIDVITGNEFSNTLKGNAGNDTLKGGAGDDYLDGGENDDTFVGGAGKDTIVGGSGTNDLVDYSYESQNITVDFADGIVNIGGSNEDLISGIEHYEGGAGIDIVKANSLDNTIIGNAGNDTISGGAGSDTIHGGEDFLLAFTAGQTLYSFEINGTVITVNVGAGDDKATVAQAIVDAFNADNVAVQKGAISINGTNDIIISTLTDEVTNLTNMTMSDSHYDEDTVNYSDLISGVVVNLEAGTAVSAGIGKNDLVINIENVIGTDSVDTLTGSSDDNTIEAGNSDDTLIGLDGVDYLDGGLGNDLADFSAGTQGIVVDLSDKDGDNVTNDGFGNTETAVEIEHIKGTNQKDIITGDENNNNLFGLDDSDTMFGGFGTDSLVGGDGADTLSGGLGDDFIYGNTATLADGDDAFRDVVDYSGSSTGININLSSSISDYNLSLEEEVTLATLTATGEGTDKLQDIQDIIGSIHADTIIGDENINIILAGGGKDVIYGGDGADTIVGQSGSDTILGGLDGDVIYGGDVTIDMTDWSISNSSANGSDWVDYSYIDDTRAIDADLSRDDKDSTTNNEKEIVQIGDEANSYDSVEGIFNVRGTKNNDKLKGDDDFTTVNTLDGYKGDDVIYGSFGADEIIGGAHGSKGDTVDYSNMYRIAVTALATTSYSFAIGGTNINFTSDGTGNLSDILDGLVADFNANASNQGSISHDGTNLYISSFDTITESDANLELDGRVKVDLNGTADENGAKDTSGNDVVDTLDGIENAVGTIGADEIYGNSSNNSLLGNAGDDTIEGNQGNDYIDGGAGVDILKGGTGKDTLYGGEGNDSIYGNENDDKLFGDAGNDTFVTGSGNDSVTGGAGVDLLTFSTENDYKIVANLKDGIGGDFGDIVVNGETNYLKDHIEIIKGSTYGDSINGFNGTTTNTTTTDFEDTLDGGAGNDIINGGIGDDILVGSDGSDTLNGQAGNDTIYGGNVDDIYNITSNSASGTDFVTYEDATSGVVVYLDKKDETGSDVAHETMDDGFSDGYDDLYNITGVIGSDNNDIIKGDRAHNTIIGGTGSDTIIASDGGDKIYGGLVDGADIHDPTDSVGNNGGDWLSFEAIGVLQGTNDGSTTTSLDFDRDDVVLNSVDGKYYKAVTDMTNVDLNTQDYTDTGIWTEYNVGVTANMIGGSVTGGLGVTSIFQIEHLKGTTYRDTLGGDSANNSLDGYTGDDILYGHGGADYLVGGEGDDTLRGGSGSDQYDGGAGEDILDFNYPADLSGAAEHRVWVDLSKVDSDGDATTTGVVIDDGYGTLVTDGTTVTEEGIKGIENLGGTEAFGDTLIGNNSENKIYGYGGDDLLDGKGGVDTLYGGTGADILVGGAGEDSLDGGAGNDTFYGGTGADIITGGANTNTVAFDKFWDEAAFDENTNKIEVNLTSQTTVNDGYGTSDTLSGIQRVLGSDQGDILRGSDTGYDALYGNDGDDTIFLSDSGSDHLDGGDHTDGDWLSLEYAYRGEIDLNGNDGGGTVTATNFENIIGSETTSYTQNTRAWGSTANNTFIMFGGEDYILGRAGDDTYDLGDGNDRATAGGGNDILIGGADTYTAWNVSGGSDTGDRLDYRHNYSGSGMNIILQGTSIDTNDDGSGDTNVSATIVSKTVSGLSTIADGSHDFFEISRGSSEKDYLYKDGTGSDFETYYLSTVKDIMVDDDSASNIDAYEGDDTVLGMGGDDDISGYSGADLIFGGTGADRITGDGGADRLYGDAGADNITGGADEDTLWGGIGDDRLYGDSGDDIIYDEEGTDRIDGGTAEDTVIFKDSTDGTGITVNLQDETSTDAFGNDQTITNVENVVATKDDDIIIGSNGVTNILYGKDGADTFTLSTNEVGKSDYIYGGDDSTDTSLDDKIILVNTGAGIVNDANSDILINPDADPALYEITVDMTTDNNIEFNGNSTKFYGIEHIDGSDQDDYIRADGKNNTITGGAGNDYIQGLGGADDIDVGSGDDIVEGGTGDDILKGGDGIDTLVYTTSTAGVTVNLDSSNLTSTGANIGTDTISGFENIIGSGSGDTLTGDNENVDYGNTIYGQGGNDSIYGLAGDDELHGGDANDKIDGGTGSDKMYGDDGDDIFISNAGTDLFDGGNDSDTVDYSGVDASLNVTLNENGIDTTVNINGADTLKYIENLIGSNTQADSIVGNSESNTLEGMAGDDTLKGGTGADRLLGGAGADRIFAGVDTDNDYIDGGDTDQSNGDWIDYSTHTTAVDIDLTINRATGVEVGTDTVVGIENIKLGSGDDTAHGSVYSNSFIGGTGNDTLTYANASNNVTIDFDAGTATGNGDDKFIEFENFVGTSKADIFRKDTISADTTFVGMDAGANSDGLDTADYSEATIATTVDVNGAIITIDDGSNDDVLENFEVLKLGTGSDAVTLTDISGIDTIDGGTGAGVDSLTVIGTNVDLSDITLLNFEEILAKNGQIVTISAKDIDGQTMKLHTEGNGQIIVKATTNMNDHDFDNITVQNDATGKITLDVNNNLDLSGKNIEGISGNIFDEFDVATGMALTVKATQIDDENVVSIGDGNLIIKSTTTASDHDFANLTNTGNGDITLDVDNTVDLKNQNLGAINRYDVAASQTLTLFNTQLIGAMIIAGAGSIELHSATADANIDLSSLVDDGYTGTITVNDGTANNTIVLNDENSTVNLTSGDDTVTLGTGTNTVNIKANDLTNADTIDATAGSNDTLNITTAGTSIDLTNVNQIETINLANGTNTVKVGANTTIINGGSGADTFNITKANLSSADVIDAKGGTDVLNITDTSGSLNFTDADFTDLSNFETLNLGDGSNDTITLGSTQIQEAGFDTINTRAGDDTVTIIDTTGLTNVDGGANGTDNLIIGADGLSFASTNIANFETITANGTVNLSGGLDNQVSNINVADTKKVTVSAADFNGDTIAIATNASGEVIITADTATPANNNFASISKTGTGDITLDVNGDVDLSGETLGAGIDRFDVANGATLTLSSTQLTGTMKLTGGGTIILNSATANSNIDLSSLVDDSFTGNIVVNEGNGSNTIKLTDENTTLNLMGGDDTVTLGSGTNIVNVDSTNLTSADTITATSGSNDTLNITTTGTSDLSGVSGIETINLKDGGVNTITVGTNSGTINGGDNADTFKFTITDLSSADTINGNGGTDIIEFINAGTITATQLTNIDVENINLANGVNAITVGTKNFNITGGTGVDTFYYAIDDLSNLDTINGVDATNKITFTTAGVITSGDFANVTNVSEVNFHTGNDTVTIADNDTKLDNVTLNLGTGTNEVIYADIADLTTSDKIVGSGTDTISFSNSGALNSNVFTNISGIDKVDFFTGADTVTLGDNALDTVNLNLNSGSDIVNIAKTNLTSADNIDAGAGDTDVLNITDAGGTYTDADFTNLSNFETLNLSDSGSDTITLGGTEITDAGFTTINTRGGDDTIKIDMEDLTSSMTIDGGANTGTGDTLDFQTNGTLDFSNLSNVSNIENIDFAAGTDEVVLDDLSEFNKLGSHTLTGLEGTDDKLSLGFDGNLDFTNLDGFEELELQDGGNNVTIDSGNEGSISKITGGTGDDNFTLDFSNINDVDGGIGTDTVNISGYSGQTFTADSFSNIEALNLVDNNTVNMDASDINSWLDGTNTNFTISGAGDDTVNISTSDANYRWSDDGGTNWSYDDISLSSTATDKTYLIDTDNGGATQDISLTIAAS